jgi:type II secretory pathway pseudopilin PulG
MTYISRGRTITEVMVAVLIVGFLVGFVSVLCIGNYFRAKRAMERQKQRRLARLSSNGGQGIIDSPRSHQSSATSGGGSVNDEQQYLLSRAPDPTRRRNKADETGDLLLMDENRHTANLMSV